MKARKTVAVYLSSKIPNDDAASDAFELGRSLVLNGYEVCFGGRAVGCMGKLADGVASANGRAIGYVPERLATSEPKCFDQRAIQDNPNVMDSHPLQRRKFAMFRKADAAIAAPGGFGTLDEIAEILTLNQLGYITTPVILLNTDGFWNDLLKHISKGYEEGFIPRDPFGKFLFVASAVDACISIVNAELQKGLSL